MKPLPDLAVFVGWFGFLFFDDGFDDLCGVDFLNLFRFFLHI